MSHIFPCSGCPLRDGCELREDFRQRAKAARATSIKFHCDRLRAELRPGRRVVVTAPRFGCDINASNYYEEYTEEYKGIQEVTATITAVDGYRFQCTTDPRDEDENKWRFRKRKAHRSIVRFLDEPDTTVCSQGCVVRDDLCDRGETFFTGERAMDSLCHCGRERWAAHRENQP